MLIIIIIIIIVIIIIIISLLQSLHFQSKLEIKISESSLYSVPASDVVSAGTGSSHAAATAVQVPQILVGTHIDGIATTKALS